MSVYHMCLAAELVAAVGYFNQRQALVQQEADNLSDEVRDRVMFLELQAQVRLMGTFFVNQFKVAWLLYSNNVSNK